MKSSYKEDSSAIDVSSVSIMERKLYRFKPWKVGLFLFGVNLVVDVGFAWMYGALLPGPKTHGLLAERMVWTSDLLIPAVIFGYSVWIQKLPSRVFESLIGEGIVVSSPEIEREIARIESLATSPLLKMAAMIVGVLGGLSFVLSIPVSNPAYTGWVVVHPVLPWVRGIMTSVTIYGACIFLFDISILLRSLNRCFAIAHIRVRPFHIDGAGGLGIVGRFVSTLGFFLGAFGLHVSVSLFSNTLPAGISSIGIMYFAKIGGLLAYVLVAPLIFFLPLYSGHLAMLRWRNTLLGEIERNIEGEMRLLHEALGTTTALTDILARMNGLREAYSQVSDFPVWPFNQKSLKRYFGIVTSSIIPGTVSIMIDLRGLL